MPTELNEFAVKFNEHVKDSTLEDLTQRYSHFRNVFGDDPKQRRLYVGRAKDPQEAVDYIKDTYGDEIKRASIPSLRRKM